MNKTRTKTNASQLDAKEQQVMNGVVGASINTIIHEIREGDNHVK